MLRLLSRLFWNGKAVANGKTAPQPAAPLAVLSADERESIGRISDIIADATALMERGRNDLWEALSRKYQLPKKFNYNPATGEVFPDE